MEITTLEHIPLEYLQEDPHNPRELSESGEDISKDRLLESITEFGILQPLVVMETDVANRYTIMDGCRRYRRAKQLKKETAPCCVYPKLQKGDFVCMQFEVQNMREDWKPRERANAISRIKQILKVSNVEVAKHLRVSTSIVQSALSMLELASKYNDRMDEFKLPSTYRDEFVRIVEKIQKTVELEINPIITILFQKVKDNVIKTAKEFRIVGKVYEDFVRTEQQIYKFLRDPAMTVYELEERTRESPIMLYGKKFIAELGVKLSNDEKFSREERKMCSEIQDAIAAIAV